MPEAFLWGLFFYLIGYLGFVIRVLVSAVRLGKRLDIVDDYVRENSLVILISALCYNAVIIIWAFSDLLTALPTWFAEYGLAAGELSAWTLAVGFLSDLFFFWVMDLVKKRLEQSKDGDQGPPTP